jgi:hypothetical protein
MDKKKPMAASEPPPSQDLDYIRIRQRGKSKDKKKLKPREEPFLSDLEQTKSRLLALAAEKVAHEELPVSRPT